MTLERFNEVLAALETGELRVAEKTGGEWKVNAWVKEVILAGFRLGKITDMSAGQFAFALQNRHCDSPGLRNFSASSSWPMRD